MGRNWTVATSHLGRGVIAMVMFCSAALVAVSAGQQPVVEAVGVTSLGGAFSSLVPARLLETRAGLSTVDGQFQQVGLREAGSVTEVVVAGRGGVSADAAAVSLNVTVSEARGAGFVTVWPCGDARPLASNLNYVSGQTVPNAVLSKIGVGGKVCLFTPSAIELIVDVNGAVNDDWLMDATLAAGTVVVSGSDVVAVAAGSDTGGTVQLAASSKAPAPGGQLVVVPHPLAPEGLVGEVVAVTSNSDGRRTITLAPTSLDEAFTELSYDYEGAFAKRNPSGAGPRVQAAPDNIVPNAAGDCAGNVSPGFAVDFTGGELDFDFKPFDSHFLARIDGTVSVSLQSGVSVGFSCEVTFPALTFIIPMATIEVAPVLSISISAGVQIDSNLAVPFSVGVEVGDGGQIRNISEMKPGGAGGIGPIAISGSASVRAGIVPVIKFLGLAGGSVNLGVELAGSLLPFLNPCATITAQASVQLAFEVGRWGIDWDLTLATLNFPKVTLYKKTNGCPEPKPCEWIGTATASMYSLTDTANGGPLGNGDIRDESMTNLSMTSGTGEYFNTGNCNATITGSSSRSFQGASQVVCGNDVILQTGWYTDVMPSSSGAGFYGAGLAKADDGFAYLGLVFGSDGQTFPGTQTVQVGPCDPTSGVYPYEPTLPDAKRNELCVDPETRELVGGLVPATAQAVTGGCTITATSGPTTSTVTMTWSMRRADCDVTVDSDGDQLADCEEFNRGTHPGDVDTDDDGFIDGYEVTNGTDPLIPD